MHCLSSVYFVSQPLHDSGIFVAHHQEVHCIYTTIGTRVVELHHKSDKRQPTKEHNTHQFLCIYSISPDDGLKICQKHVEVDCRNKLRINSASSWFSLHTSMEMHGQQNVKFGTFTIDCTGLVIFYSEERSRRTLPNVCKHVLHHTMSYQRITTSIMPVTFMFLMKFIAQTCSRIIRNSIHLITSTK